MNTENLSRAYGTDTAASGERQFKVHNRVQVHTKARNCLKDSRVEKQVFERA
jgi:hypothetical protein